MTAYYFSVAASAVFDVQVCRARDMGRFRKQVIWEGSHNMPNVHKDYPPRPPLNSNFFPYIARESQGVSIFQKPRLGERTSDDLLSLKGWM